MNIEINDITFNDFITQLDEWCKINNVTILKKDVFHKKAFARWIEISIESFFGDDLYENIDSDMFESDLAYEFKKEGLINFKEDE